MAVWHGEVAPDGMAEMHVHKEMEQAFYILDGEARFGIDGEEYRVRKGYLVFIPRNTRHQITSVGGDTDLKVLIIMVPPPSSWRRGRRSSAYQDIGVTTYSIQSAGEAS